MGRREQAREEAAFMRGDVGVDGRATEEKPSAVVQEKEKAQEQLLRGKAFLGRELLTWLLWRSESGDPMVEHDGQPVTVLFFGRMVLRGVAGDVVELSVKGAEGPYSRLVKQALGKGLLPHVARLRFTHGERIYELSLDAEHLDVKGAKLPEMLSDEEDERLLERLELAEQMSAILSLIVEEFMRVRVAKRWAQTVTAIREWAAETEAEAEKEREKEKKAGAKKAS